MLAPAVVSTMGGILALLIPVALVIVVGTVLLLLLLDGGTATNFRVTSDMNIYMRNPLKRADVMEGVSCACPTPGFAFDPSMLLLVVVMEILMDGCVSVVCIDCLFVSFYFLFRRIIISMYRNFCVKGRRVEGCL